MSSSFFTGRVKRVTAGLLQAAVLFAVLAWDSSAARAADPVGCMNEELRKFFSAYGPLDPHQNPSTVGVEIEGYIPREFLATPGKARARFATQLEQILLQLLPFGTQVQVQPMTQNYWKGARQPDWYLVGYTLQGRRHEWKVLFDGSLGSTPTREGVEIASPVLAGEQDIYFFLTVLQRLERAGLRADPVRAGLHVHVGMPDAMVAETGALVRLFSQVELEMVEAFSQTTTRNLFARRTPLDLLVALESALENHIPLDTLLRKRRQSTGIFQTRLLNLNLEALLRHETVEFRLFNSTLDPQAIRLMVDFSRELVRRVRTQDPRLLAYLARTGQGKVSLEGLAEAIGVPLGRHRQVLLKLANESIVANLLVMPRLAWEAAEKPLGYIRDLVSFAVLGVIFHQALQRAEEFEKRCDPAGL